jgi:hypothetical protein
VRHRHGAVTRNKTTSSLRVLLLVLASIAMVVCGIA